MVLQKLSYFDGVNREGKQKSSVISEDLDLSISDEVKQKSSKMSSTKVPAAILAAVLLLVATTVSGAHWDHAVDLDENYRLLWSINNQDITFEVQARTLGYVGLGFSTDGSIYGADVVIGWVDNGQVHFQVSDELRLTIFRGVENPR